MKIFWRLFFCLLFVGFGVSTVIGDTGKIKINPYITVQEEYNDNIYLTSKSPKSDWLTSIYPGIKISGQEKTYGLDLDYRLGLTFFGSNPENNFISHSGKLNTFYAFSPQWRLGLKENILKSTDTREVDPLTSTVENQSYYSTNQGRFAFLRNVVEPVLEYQFGKEDRVSLTYRNNFFQTQNPQSQNSQENVLKASLAYWLNIRNGLLLDYSFSKGLFERSADLISHLSRFRYTYRFNPTTSLFGEYSFQRNESPDPTREYSVHNPSLGFDHAFSPTLSGTLQGGYFWKNFSSGITNGYSYQVSLNQRDRRTTYLLSLQGGYTQDYFTAQNLGFTRYNRAFGRIAHQILERLTLSITGMIERAEFDNNRTDWISGITGSLTYQALKWLTLSLEASHREDNSTVDSYSYMENRAIFKITAIY
jgi:hypothetical protein